MKEKQELLALCRDYLSETLEDQKLRVLIKFDDIQSLQLVDIRVDNKQDSEKTRYFTTFIHEFLLNGHITLNIDILEHDAHAKTVAPTGDYDYFYTTYDGSMINRNYYVEDFGVCDLLDDIGYSMFFYDQFELVDKLARFHQDNESTELYEKVKDWYPGLRTVTHTRQGNEIYMWFYSGAKLRVSKTNLLFSLTKHE